MDSKVFLLSQSSAGTVLVVCVYASATFNLFFSTPTWHLDEVFIRIRGVLHYLWRAVDQSGVVLDILGGAMSRALYSAFEPDSRGLVPAIHTSAAAQKAWMAATSAATTTE